MAAIRIWASFRLQQWPPASEIFPFASNVVHQASLFLARSAVVDTNPELFLCPSGHGQKTKPICNGFTGLAGKTPSFLASNMAIGYILNRWASLNMFHPLSCCPFYSAACTFKAWRLDAHERGGKDAYWFGQF